MKFSYKLSAVLSLIGCTLGAAHSARAQANLVFSGGSGKPMTITLTAPVSYTITAVPTSTSCLFDLDGIGNIFPTGANLSGSLAFTVNGGSPIAINLISSNYNNNAITPDDAIIDNAAANINAHPNLKVGDIVVLAAGSVTTTANVTAAAPTSGAFTTFMVDGSGLRNSANGVAITAAAPEPGSIALLLAAGLPVGCLLRRRVKR